MTVLSEHEILWNSAALCSLRRPQLMSLSKKYGLKANGKNSEMAARLHEFGASLTPSSKAVFAQASEQAADEQHDSPTKKHPNAPDNNELAPSGQEEQDVVSAHLSIPTRPMRSMPSSRTLGRGSDAWEVLTTGNASLEEITEQHYEEDTVPRAWKSANNGEKLAGEFKGNTELRGVGSLRSLASSIRRTASRTLSGRQNKEGRSPTPSVTFPGVSAEDDQPVDRETEELAEDDLPPSPASAIGVAKRHSTMSLHHRPSTIRMVSPSPVLGMNFERAMSPELDDDDELPLTGQNTVEQIKQRRSMAPVREQQFPPSALRMRNSAPTLLSPTASKNNISNIYPELPTFDTLAAPGAPRQQSPTKRSSSPNKARSPSPGIPGAFPSATSPSFVFGQPHKPAEPQFSAAGLKLLEEMQAKMGASGGTFNPELLKGKRAQMTKLVSVNEDLANGPGGWGLSAGPSAQNDRYAEAHQRQFAKMRSLSSSTKSSEPRSRSTSASRPSPPKRKHQSAAPDMASEQIKDAAVAESDRTAKRTKVSTGPRYLETLRGAGRSIAGKLSEDKPPANLVSPRKKSSLKPESIRKFAFLRSKKAADTVSIAESVRSEGSYILPSPSVPVDVQHRPAPPKKGSIPPPSRMKRSDTASSISTMVGGSHGSQGGTGLAPQIPTVLAFGEAASRTNRLFESNFHMSQPVVGTAKRSLPVTPASAGPFAAASPAAVEKLKSPSKAGSVYSSPAKAGSISATRARDRTSGVAALKSKGHHDDKAVAQRRAEIKARQERLATERELRRMLG
ncbi:uncharacterized protein LOC62_05G007018 [Vanrija pseudolonga]|uniref:SAP domain-containing protein n=1 Tax=Vanrija pseudolonga TaxID=143232 RepID=A0AAF0YBM7_9TREE|nr:hypothetical protein LOC62_05G007018 [Vanrija pseudolonga]